MDDYSQYEPVNNIKNKYKVSYLINLLKKIPDSIRSKPISFNKINKLVSNDIITRLHNPVYSTDPLNWSTDIDKFIDSGPGTVIIDNTYQKTSTGFQAWLIIKKIKNKKLYLLEFPLSKGDKLNDFDKNTIVNKSGVMINPLTYKYIHVF